MDEQSSAERIHPRERISFGEEREKLLNNLIALRSLAAEMAVISRELKCLREESDFLHADVRALKSKLNQTALEFGLQPLQ